MFTINVKADVEQARKDAANLTPRQFSKAVSRAINRTLMLGRTEARTAVKKVYTIAQRYLPGTVDIKRSTPARLWGAVTASAVPVPMDAFNVQFSYSATSISTISKRGVQKTKLNSRGRQGGGILLEAQRGNKEIIPFAFFLPTMSGKVFARGQYRPGGGSWGFVRRHVRQENSTGNDSVKPLLSVTVHAAIINPKSEKMIADRIEPNFLRNLQHELNVISNGIVN